MTDPSSYTLFIRNLKRLRALRGYTQEVLAERCGSTKNYISQLETGRRQPSHDMLDSLSMGLEVSPMEFYRSFDYDETEAEGQPVEERKPELYSMVRKAVLDAMKERDSEH